MCFYFYFVGAPKRTNSKWKGRAMSTLLDCWQLLAACDPRQLLRFTSVRELSRCANCSGQANERRERLGLPVTATDAECEAKEQVCLCF